MAINQYLREQIIVKRREDLDLRKRLAVTNFSVVKPLALAMREWLGDLSDCGAGYFISERLDIAQFYTPFWEAKNWADEKNGPDEILCKLFYEPGGRSNAGDANFGFVSEGSSKLEARFTKGLLKPFAHKPGNLSHDIDVGYVHTEKLIYYLMHLYDIDLGKILVDGKQRYKPSTGHLEPEVLDDLVNLSLAKMLNVTYYCSVRDRLLPVSQNIGPDNNNHERVIRA